MTGNRSAGIGMTSARTRDRLVERLRREGITNTAVLDRLREVPRHLFVDEALASHAYEDTALPLGHGQTISQPYVVAFMTQALIDDRPPNEPLAKVLEIGSGCGYQTAVLASFARHVYSIERIQPLLKRAQKLMRILKINNVSMRHADGMKGWPSRAPFDGILVAAAPESVPSELLEQLADGGRLIIPIGPSGHQSLLRITRHNGEFKREELLAVSFVPLVGGTK